MNVYDLLINLHLAWYSSESNGDMDKNILNIYQLSEIYKSANN